jgi:hypothetical protein
MPKNTKARLTLALLLTAALIDLQLYRYRFHRPTEMLGQYLRQQLDQPACGRLASTVALRRCLPHTPQRDANASGPGSYRQSRSGNCLLL